MDEARAAHWITCEDDERLCLQIELGNDYASDADLSEGRRNAQGSLMAWPRRTRLRAGYNRGLPSMATGCPSVWPALRRHDRRARVRVKRAPEVSLAAQAALVAIG